MEDRANEARGHKAAMHNPNVSEEAKQHSKKVLRDEYGNDTTYADEAQHDKNPGNVAGGLKATMHNPRVSEQAKKSAEERLGDL